MSIKFSKDEKEQLDRTFKVVVEDLRNLYYIAETDSIKTELTVIENETENTYTLVINKKEMYLKLHYSDWYMNLDKVSTNKKQKICHIKDYTLVFEFLKKYERVRDSIVRIVTEKQKNKKQGMERVKNLYNKYTKEAIVEVEMPETNNRSSIEITKEDGKNIGRVTIGPVSLKILTSENVSIIGAKQLAKVKKK